MQQFFAHFKERHYKLTQYAAVLHILKRDTINSHIGSSIKDFGIQGYVRLFEIL